MKTIFLTVAFISIGFIACFILQVTREKDHQQVVKEYREHLKMEISPTSDYYDFRKSLLALEASGELRHVELIFPDVPLSAKAIEYWQKFCDKNDFVMYGYANPSSPDLKPPQGVPRLHLVMWVKSSSMKKIQELIFHIDQTYSQLNGNDDL